MFDMVMLPVWVIVLLVVLAAVAFLDRMLMPSLRWYLRRRLKRAILRLNDHLQLRIQPFKLTRRRVMVDRLLSDPKVMQAVTEYAIAEDMPQDIAVHKARRYALEIVPSFSVFAYFGFAIRAARFLSTALYRVRLGFVDQTALELVDPDATVVFVMNHRSNMDYVLVTYLAAQRSALSYAVGEWARVWPLQQLIRSLGAYFIRRKSCNPLYRKVLARYVQMATEGGVSQAIFPEGGLSLDGRPRQAKLGLLSYILEGFDPDGARDVMFIPVGLNYDRVLEDRVLTSVDPDGERRFGFNMGVFLGFVGRQIWLRLTKRFYRYGYACVSFGCPVSLKGFVADHSGPADTLTEELGGFLMQRVARVIPVLPVPLVATALCEVDGVTSRLAIKARCYALLVEFTAAGAHVHLPDQDQDYAVEIGLRILKLRHLIDEEGGTITIAPQHRSLLLYYANSIEHLRRANISVT